MASIDALHWYYKKYFPCVLIWRWLGCDRHRLREFAYSGKNKDGKEFFTRYKTYVSAVSFRTGISVYGLQRIEIGPEYNRDPLEREKVEIYPVRRELVFDLDINDYDNVRSCCTGTNICIKCWIYIRAAIKVITHMLTKAYGFKHIMWVFSGRRGVHCWVKDRDAMNMDMESRQSVLSFMKEPSVHNISPIQEECIGILNQIFVGQVLPQLNVISNEKTMFPASVVEIQLPKDKDSEELWFFHIPQSVRLKILLYYMWPRLDSEVTKSMNHLIKTPFSVHPATGKISVPIPPNEIDSFDPNRSPPTLSSFFKDKQTLEPYLDYFRYMISLLK